MELGLAIALALGLYLLGHYLNRRAHRQHQQHLNALQSATLQRAIALLQHLQKHRGLGAQQDISSVSQRNVLARQLDQLWLNWPGPSLQLAPLQQDWPKLRRHPADFAAHCQVIEGLLQVIEQLEERLRLAGNPPLQGIGALCRSLEDLARLRGLAVRAANYQRCPSGLQEQMRQLCHKLEHSGASTALHQTLQRLEQDLIDAPRIRLAPRDCFELFAPLIDDCLGPLRHNPGLGL
ncbi:hypothetical protein [Pseudomonas xionganensis]|uniref:Nitrate/nitrite sensing protein domain-containing protein n=1 Tax=Pseudomonas xionganensis TaxID=2654845 RepID=A0A6I4KUS8_9PSED|nr:hypothetical protein [Pseudomonas xionganensis]MVW76459.1 hypothetical protein [Pseudomonas xionganensis]